MWTMSLSFKVKHGILDCHTQVWMQVSLFCHLVWQITIQIYPSAVVREVTSFMLEADHMIRWYLLISRKKELIDAWMEEELLKAGEKQRLRADECMEECEWFWELFNSFYFSASPISVSLPTACLESLSDTHLYISLSRFNTFHFSIKVSKVRPNNTDITNPTDSSLIWMLQH